MAAVADGVRTGVLPEAILDRIMASILFSATGRSLAA
jgi:hypothetical protein